MSFQPTKTKTDDSSGSEIESPKKNKDSFQSSIPRSIDIKSIANVVFNSILKGLYIVTAIFIAAILTNQVLVYPYPIRIIVFLISLLLAYVSPFFIIINIVFLVFSGFYTSYTNSLIREIGSEKEFIFPPIFAILPITVTPAESFLGKILNYPFFYPRTGGDKDKLNQMIGKHYESLKNSIVEVTKAEKEVKGLTEAMDFHRKGLYLMHNFTPPSLD